MSKIPSHLINNAHQFSSAFKQDFDPGKFKDEVIFKRGIDRSRQREEVDQRHVGKVDRSRSDAKGVMAFVKQVVRDVKDTIADVFSRLSFDANYNVRGHAHDLVYKTVLDSTKSYFQEVRKVDFDLKEAATAIATEIWKETTFHKNLNNGHNTGAFLDLCESVERGIRDGIKETGLVIEVSYKENEEVSKDIVLYQQLQPGMSEFVVHKTTEEYIEFLKLVAKDNNDVVEITTSSPNSTKVQPDKEQRVETSQFGESGEDGGEIVSSSTNSRTSVTPGGDEGLSFEDEGKVDEQQSNPEFDEQVPDQNAQNDQTIGG